MKIAIWDWDKVGYIKDTFVPRSRGFEVEASSKFEDLEKILGPLFGWEGLICHSSLLILFSPPFGNVKLIENINKNYRIKIAIGIRNPDISYNNTKNGLFLAQEEMKDLKLPVDKIPGFNYKQDFEEIVKYFSSNP